MNCRTEKIKKNEIQNGELFRSGAMLLKTTREIDMTRNAIADKSSTTRVLSW
jgi:hypothetical protein